MIPGCVSIANCHEHTAGEVPFLPELSKGMLGVGRIAGNLFGNTRWMTGGRHLLERVASLRREMLGSDLSVQAHTMIMCFSAEGEQTRPRGGGQGPS